MLMSDRAEKQGVAVLLKLRSRRGPWLVLAVLALIAWPLDHAWAKRVALVVGNSEYDNPDYVLPNPSNDASAMARLLRDLGFEVIEAIDQDYAGMRRTLQRFGRELRDADAGLFFYAGHGMEFRGVNYLVPTDAELQAESDVYVSLMSLNDILRTMESSVATRLIILDACRDNPLARTLQRSMPASRSGSVNSGLARVNAAVGTLIAYSTAPGEVAADGVGDNSPFTSALLEHLPTPGLDAREIFTRVRRDVVEVSDRQQVPWESSSLLGNFYFINKPIEPEPEPAPVAAVAPPAPVQPAPGGGFDSGLLELRAWELAQTLQSQPAFEAYQSGFCPGGRFCAFADLMLKNLTAQAAAVAAAPPINRGEQTPANIADIEPSMGDVVDAVDADLKVQVEEEAEAEQIVELAALADAMPQEEAPPAPIETPLAADPANETTAAEIIAAEPTPQSIEWDLQLSREMWRELQDRLTRLGYDTRGVDGLPGARTRQAVAEWQASTEFDETGYFDALALDALLTTQMPEPPPENPPEPAVEVAQIEQLVATEETVAAVPEVAEPEVVEPEAADLAAVEPEVADPAVAAVEEGSAPASLPVISAPVVEPLPERVPAPSEPEIVAIEPETEPTPVPAVDVSEPEIDPEDGVAAPVVITTITDGPTDPDGQLRLGMAYLTGQGAEQNESRAVRWLTFAAEQGEVTAQSVLGTLYDDGRGVAEDDAQAVRWYRAAAEQGDLAAQFNLGIMYANGNGIAQDDGQAFTWFKAAAERGNVAAMFNIAVRYAQGRGVARDDAQAVNWYRQAADTGDADAQLNLGVMYAEGRGIARDDQAAVEWYRRSAEQGNARAQFNLAIMYEAGRGVASDAEQAEFWYGESAKPR